MTYWRQLTLSREFSITELFQALLNTNFDVGYLADKCIVLNDLFLKSNITLGSYV